MKDEEALQMFKDLENEYNLLLEEESINVIIEKALIIGYDYAIAKIIKGLGEKRK